MWSIANRFGTTVDTLRTINNLSTNTLQVGQVLKLPTTNTSTGNNNGNTYTVKSGDSLWSIARKYDTTVSELQNLNNLTSTTLQVGQVLQLPSTTTSGQTYIVKAGDSLWNIANRFGTTVDVIKEKNNLTNNNLTIGQILTI